MSNQKLPPQGRRISFQDFGFGHTLLQVFADYAKNQFISLEISKLAPCGRFEQWIFPAFHSLIFLNDTYSALADFVSKVENRS